MLFNSQKAENGRAGMFGLTALSLRFEWAYDLDMIVFGLQTGVDKASGYWYAKAFFGPFYASVLLIWGGIPRLNHPEDKKQEGKDQVSGP